MSRRKTIAPLSPAAIAISDKLPTKPRRESKAFQELIEHWYEKLKKAKYKEAIDEMSYTIKTFEDIDPEDSLSVPRQYFKTRKKQYIQGTIGYDELCRQILNDAIFQHEEYKLIWELHTLGKKASDIVYHLSAVHKSDFTPQGVNKIIREIKREFLEVPEPEDRTYLVSINGV